MKKIKRILLFLVLLIPFSLNAQTATEYNSKGVKALKLKKFIEAAELFEKSIELKNDYDLPYFNKGLTNIELKEYFKAIADFEESIKFSKSDSIKKRALIKIAYVHRNKLKNLKIALGYSNRSIEIDSMYSYAHHMRGLILHDIGRLEEAIENFDRAIEISPLVPDLYYDRAIAKRKLNRIQEAIEDYSMSIKLDSSYTRAYNNRGFARLKIEDYKGAIKDFSGAIDLNDEAYSYNNRGFAKYKLGDYDSAKIDCEKSIELDPSNSWAYHYLGLIYYELRLEEEACKMFQMAVDLGKEDAKIDIKEKCIKQ